MRRLYTRQPTGIRGGAVLIRCRETQLYSPWLQILTIRQETSLPYMADRIIGFVLPRHLVLGQEAHCFPEVLREQEPHCTSEML